MSLTRNQLLKQIAASLGVASSNDSEANLNDHQLLESIALSLAANQGSVGESQKTAETFASNFGAKGGGVTDDTTAIQNALDYAGNLLQLQQLSGFSGESIVRLTGGTYKISSTLTVRNGTTLIGDTKAPPYPNRISGFKNNNNLFTGTEIVCSSDFVGEEAILLESDNTNVENIILDGHSIPCGTTWCQIDITTAQKRWISTAFIKFPVHDPNDKRIQSFRFDNVEIPFFRVGEYFEFQLQGIGGTGEYSFALESGKLPEGLNVDQSGLISGICTRLEKVYAGFTISDGVNSFTRTFKVGTILDEIETRDILPATVGADYTFQLKTWNNEPNLTWKGINLPDFLSISETGQITNSRVTTNDDVHHFNFKIELYYEDKLIDKRAYHSEIRYDNASIKIFGEQTLTPQIGVPFNYQYLASGGYGDFTWSISFTRSNVDGNANLVTGFSPYSGLTLDPNTGIISGTTNEEGENTYYLRATSNFDNSIFFEGKFYIKSILEGNTPRILTRSLATAVVGKPYSFQFNVEDIESFKPYKYKATNLPTGLSMDENLLITGTPTGAKFVSGIRLQWSDSVKNCTIRGFRSGAGIFSNEDPSNVHRLEHLMISACDAGIRILSQAYDSHASELYIFGSRLGLDFGAGAAAWSFNGRIRIEYIHEYGATFTNAHENDLSGVFFDTCGWSAIRAKDCRNLLVSGCRFFRSGRNIRGIGTKLNPQGNKDYSNHIFLENCKRFSFTSIAFDIGTKASGDAIYLVQHFADNIRPTIGFRIHNTPELTITGNNLTGCIETFSANLTDFGENDYSGHNIANNTQSDRELAPLEVTKLAKQELTIPNNCFSVWQRDKEFQIPVATDGNPSTFPIADSWFVTRGGNIGIDKDISVSHRSDAPLGPGDYLHLEKVAGEFTGYQKLEIHSPFASKLEFTSNRSIILSYWAKSITNCSLGIKMSQYADSGDNKYQSYQFQDNNRRLAKRWKRYQHHFSLADLTGISLGENAIFNIIFRCDRAEENIDLDITGVQVDFTDITPFAQPLRYKPFSEEIAFAQLRYQKSKAYDQYFPSWVDNYRYDVNGANWQSGFINQDAISNEGHSLRETVLFNSPIPSATSENLSLLNPGELTNQNSSTKFNWSGLDSPAASISRIVDQGFTVSAMGETVNLKESYSLHYLYSAYKQDKIINGGGYSPILSL